MYIYNLSNKKVCIYNKKACIYMAVCMCVCCLFFFFFGVGGGGCIDKYISATSWPPNENS